MLGQIEPFYFSLYSVIFHRTILFFLLGYSNCPSSREYRRSSITQKKPAIQRILNTPMGQIPCIAGFLDTNNKRIDRSIDTMLRSILLLFVSRKPIIQGISPIGVCKILCIAGSFCVMELVRHSQSKARFEYPLRKNKIVL